jgi:aspartate/methionine/tyrosine aminotransferase
MEYKRLRMVTEAPEELGRPIVHGFSESGVKPRSLSDLGIVIPTELPLAHTKHKGSDRLCSLIANPDGLDKDDIIITIGASSALFIVASAILTHKDHLVITSPNYPANIATGKATHCDISFVDLHFSTGYRLDLDQIAAAIQPNTRLISITNPNNPTGTSLTTEDLHALAELAKACGCYLLIDETYSNMIYSPANYVPAAASLGPHVIGVSSMSKAYGVPGIRIGWISTTNKQLQETFLAAKELQNISVSVLDESAAEQILQRRDELLQSVRSDLQQRRDIVDSWIKSEEEFLEWILPEAGAIGFIRMKKEPPGGTLAFYERLLREHGTYVGPGRWFEQPDTFFRIGFGYPSLELLHEGLAATSKVLHS